MPQLLEGAPDPTPNPSDVLANALIIGSASGAVGSMAIHEFINSANAFEEAAGGVTLAVIGYAVGRVVATKALEFMNTRKSNRRHLVLQAEVAEASARADRLGLRDDF